MRLVKKWTKDERKPYILITPDGERIDLRKAGGKGSRSLVGRQEATSKYRNVGTEYDDKRYDSGAEANYAAELDIKKRVGEIKSWTRQVKFPFVINGIKICTYYADFLVEMQDGSKEVHEVKGRMTDVARIKLLLFEALYPEIQLKIIQV